MADMTVEQLIDEIEVYIDNCRTTGVLGGGSMIKVAIRLVLQKMLPGFPEKNK